MESHRYVSELEVALDRYTPCGYWLLYCWIHCWKGEEKRRHAVHELMKVEYYHAQLQNHHLAVVSLIGILSYLCGGDEGE